MNKLTIDFVKQAVEALSLEEGYKKEVERHKTFQLLKTGEQVPNFDHIMEWLRGLKPETLAHVNDFQGSSLILETKGRSFNDLAEAMDDNRQVKDQKKTYVSDIYDPYKHQKAENWGVGIAESPTDLEVHAFDNKSFILGNRLPLFTSYEEATGVSGMDETDYAHFAMNHVLEIGQFPDQKGWTILPKSPALSASHVPGADFRPDFREVDFGWIHPGYRDNDGRFRRLVRGDVNS